MPLTYTVYGEHERDEQAFGVAAEYEREYGEGRRDRKEGYFEAGKRARERKQSIGNRVIYTFKKSVTAFMARPARRASILFCITLTSH